MRSILTGLISALLFTVQLNAADLAKAYTFRSITTPIDAGSGSGPNAREVMIRSWGVVADSKGNVYYSDFSNMRVIRLAPDGSYSRYAGTGTFGPTGDGGPASEASVIMPTGLAIDAQDNIYISETGGGRVRKVSSSGIISTVAGGGQPSAGNGDGGLATAAYLNIPYGIAVDSKGNVFVSEILDYRIRRVDAASGRITTCAGSGTYGNATDDPVQATQAQIGYVIGLTTDPAGNLYIGDWFNNKLRRVSPDGTLTTALNYNVMKLPPGYLAAFNPFAIHFASNGYIYIANNTGLLNGAHVVFKCRLDGNCTLAVGSLQQGGTFAHPGYAGDGGPASAAKIADPRGIFVDAAGNLYVSEVRRIRKVTPDGNISTIAGNTSAQLAGDGGPVSAAKILAPQGTAFDSNGNLYVADSEGQRVWKLSTEGRATIFAGSGSPGFSGDNGPAAQADLAFPTDVALDKSGNVFIADRDNHRIRKVTPDGTISTFAGRDYQICSPGSNPGQGGVNACFYNPQYVATAADGTLYIGGDYYAAYYVTTSGVVWTIPNLGAINDVDVDSDGSIYAVGGPNYTQVLRVKNVHAPREVVAGNGTGGNSGDGGPATSASMSPSSIALDHGGNLIIADQYGGVVRAVTADGNIQTIAGGGDNLDSLVDGDDAKNARIAPVAVAVRPDGLIHVSDQLSIPSRSSVRALDPANIFRTSITNTASYENGVTAPGEFLTIFGVGIGPDNLTIAKPGDAGFPKELAQTRVLFDGVPAPIYYVQESKVTVIAPYGLAGKTSTSVQIEYQGKLTNKVTVPVQVTVPGMFTTNASGTGQAAVQHWPDYSVNGAANPIKPGGVIMVYLTAGGDTGIDGAICTATHTHPLPVTLTIGGKQAQVLYAGSAPGMVYGMLQVNAKVPLDVPVGAAVPILAKVGDVSSQLRTTIAIAAQ